MSRWTAVLRADEIAEGQSIALEIGDEWILVARHGGAFFAVEDFCPHDTGPIGEGRLEDGELVCPRHGARFDIRTGRVLCFPALCGLRTFPTRVTGGHVEVDISSPTARVDDDEDQE